MCVLLYLWQFCSEDFIYCSNSKSILFIFNWTIDGEILLLSQSTTNSFLKIKCLFDSWVKTLIKIALNLIRLAVQEVTCSRDDSWKKRPP